MKKFGVFDKVKNKTVRTYYNNRMKNISLSTDEVQFELLESNGANGLDQRAYTWDGTNVIYDTNYVKVNPEDKYCKIYRYMQGKGYNKREVPLGHNYVSGLTVRLFPLRTFHFGELQQVLWYADQAKTDLVLKADIVYNRDTLGFVTSRTTTRTWICEDNTEHVDTKVGIKEYTQEQAIAEGVRRRTNVVDGFQQPAIGLMVQYAAYTPTDAVIEGSRFMESIAAEIQSYIHTPRLNHFQDALTNATETWLDSVIDGGTYTIRQYLIDFITIPTS